MQIFRILIACILIFQVGCKADDAHSISDLNLLNNGLSPSPTQIQASQDVQILGALKFANEDRLLITLTDNPDFGIMAQTSNGEALLLHTLAINEDLTIVTGVTFNTPDGESISIFMDEDGFGATAIVEDYIYRFENESSDTVDIIQIAPDGGQKFLLAAPRFPESGSNRNRQLLPSELSLHGAQDWLDEEAVLQSLKWGADLLSRYSCPLGLAAVFFTGGLAFPASVACAGLIISTLNDHIDDPSLDVAEVVTDVIDCTQLLTSADPWNCVGFTLNTSIIHLEAALDTQAQNQSEIESAEEAYLQEKAEASVSPFAALLTPSPSPNEPNSIDSNTLVNSVDYLPVTAFSSLVVEPFLISATAQGLTVFDLAALPQIEVVAQNSEINGENVAELIRAGDFIITAGRDGLDSFSLLSSDNEISHVSHVSGNFNDVQWSNNYLWAADVQAGLSVYEINSDGQLLLINNISVGSGALALEIIDELAFVSAARPRNPSGNSSFSSDFIALDISNVLSVQEISRAHQNDLIRSGYDVEVLGQGIYVLTTWGLAIFSFDDGSLSMLNAYDHSGAQFSINGQQYFPWSEISVNEDQLYLLAEQSENGLDLVSFELSAGPAAVNETYSLLLGIPIGGSQQRELDFFGSNLIISTPYSEMILVRFSP